MARFRDVDRLTPFIRAFRPMIARQMDSHIEDTYNEMVRNWRDGNNAKGEPWEPLAPETVAKKQGPATPLIETRQMIESATYGTDRGELTGYIAIEDEEGKVLAHENGVPDRGLPARPILGPTKDLLEEDSGKMLTTAFDRSWAKAQTQGTMLTIGFGSGSISGGTK